MKILMTLGLAAYLGCVVPTSVGMAHPHFQTDASVRKIRQQYGKINHGLKRYRRVKKDLSGFSLEGGQLVAYFDGQAIAKIVATYYGEAGQATETFYYWDGKLIFVLRRDSSYDEPLSGRVQATQEGRFYFSNDHLIRWLDEKGKPVAPTEDRFSDQEKEHLSTSTLFTTGARSKIKVIEAPETP